MSPRTATARPSMPSFAFAALAALLLVAGCAQQRFQGIFNEAFARKALSCLHPSGKFQSAGEVHAEGSDAFTGTIFWNGGATQNSYYTRVRVQVDGTTAVLSVVEDTSILPALNDTCRIDLGGS
jgi:hypothetical protein